MGERRGARVGTVSGLALLTGGMAVAAVAGGAQSIFASVLLGLLALGMGHALLTEIHRQARRRTTRWTAHDTANTTLLAIWSVAALAVALPAVVPLRVRAVGLLLTVGYALSSAYFVTERRRTISRTPASPKDPAPTSGPPIPGAALPDSETPASRHRD
ncbi:hypothetical protein COUCH_00925 [Couchioplanes caeruleus]|uniref:hypothetical protein n=1 Tax=Couchioplanes caeruleus TaxID=56438 RepID=UPI0020BF3145|nr:hypothetical protein [Couchioplanes caeruleus]UQU64960.1 hypothetical protein COUCH_00925 [Couchioplanes caeruleus]